MVRAKEFAKSTRVETKPWRALDVGRPLTVIRDPSAVASSSRLKSIYSQRDGALERRSRRHDAKKRRTRRGPDIKTKTLQEDTARKIRHQKTARLRSTKTRHDDATTRHDTSKKNDATRGHDANYGIELQHEDTTQTHDTKARQKTRQRDTNTRHEDT